MGVSLIIVDCLWFIGKRGRSTRGFSTWPVDLAEVADYCFANA